MAPRKGSEKIRGARSPHNRARPLRSGAEVTLAGSTCPLWKGSGWRLRRSCPARGARAPAARGRVRQVPSGGERGPPVAGSRGDRSSACRRTSRRPVAVLGRATRRGLRSYAPAAQQSGPAGARQERPTCAPALRVAVGGGDHPGRAESVDTIGPWRYSPEVASQPPLPKGTISGSRLELRVSVG